MTKWPRFRVLAGVLATALFFLCLPLRAAADDGDPPSRVARLRSVQGSVSIQPAGVDDWADAEVNRPITTGDKLWSDQDSRVELNLGSASIRLGSQTAFTFLNLTDQVSQISINEGTVDVHLRSLGDQETFEIDTPNLAFSLLRPGDYRVGVNENGDTTIITVGGGQGSVTGGGQAFIVPPNSTGTFVGTDQLSGDIGTAMPADDFDAWCNDLNVREDRAPRNVSPEVVGYEDLDGNGAWQSVPEYGQVWVPNGVVAGWAPYRYGHWAWIAPWGWTWVDAASWGYAPFHYGRWVFVGGYWGWTPGPVVVGVRPVYSPALVAWVGGPGAGLAIGVGGGIGVAWFPLGPREVYMPPYAVSRAYVTNVNITNTVVERTTVVNVYNNYQSHTTVTNVTYVNRGYVTATSQNAFTSAQPISRNVVQVNANVIAKAQVGTAIGAGVAPQPRSVLGGGTTANVRRPPAATLSRQVVAKTPPPAPAATFASQQKAIQANNGRPLNQTQLSTIKPVAATTAKAQPAVRIAPPAKPAAPAAANGNRFGQPPAGNKSAATTPAAPAANQPAARPAPANGSNGGAMGNRPDRPPSAQPPAATKPPAAPPPAAKPPALAPEAKPVAQPPARPPVTTNDNMKPAPRPPATQPPPAAKPPAPETKPAAQPPAKPETMENPNRPPANRPPPSTETQKPPAKEATPPAKAEDKPPKKTDKKPPPKEKPDKDKDKDKP
jgi:hypothetical protein